MYSILHKRDQTPLHNGPSVFTLTLLYDCVSSQNQTQVTWLDRAELEISGAIHHFYHVVIVHVHFLKHVYLDISYFLWHRNLQS